MASDADKLLTTEEVAEILRIPRSTLDFWAYERRELPYVKAGRRRVYRRSDVDAYMASRVEVVRNERTAG
jgi:excisionase family DNA binding protein